MCLFFDIRVIVFEVDHFGDGLYCDFCLASHHRSQVLDKLQEGYLVNVFLGQLLFEHVILITEIVQKSVGIYDVLSKKLNIHRGALVATLMSTLQLILKDFLVEVQFINAWQRRRRELCSHSRRNNVHRNRCNEVSKDVRQQGK